MKHLESIDTNILLRVILGDIPEKRAKALELLARPNTTYYLSSVAITEVAFVMEKQIGYTREEIQENLLRVLEACSNIQYEEEVLERALAMYVAHPKLSFDDCYLAEEATKHQREPLWTFDHKLAVQSGAAKEVK